MISALSWVHRAAAKDVPVVTEPTPEEIAEMRAAAGKSTPRSKAGLVQSRGGSFPLAYHWEATCH